MWVSKSRPRLKTPHPNRFTRKTILTLFCASCGPILIEFLQPGTTIDSEAYIDTPWEFQGVSEEEATGFVEGHKLFGPP